MDRLAGLYSRNSCSFPIQKHAITKTCLYNFDPLKPHFYIVKLGFTGVYTIFLISAQNIDCGYSLEPPCRGKSDVQNLVNPYFMCTEFSSHSYVG